MSTLDRQAPGRPALSFERWWVIPRILWAEEARAPAGLGALVVIGVLAEVGILLLVSVAIGQVVRGASTDRLAPLLAGVAVLYITRFAVAPVATALAATLDWRLRASSGNRLIHLLGGVHLADLERREVADEFARVRGLSLEAAFKPRAVSLYAEAVGQRLRLVLLVAIVAWVSLWPAVLLAMGAVLYYGWARREVRTFLSGHMVGTERFRRASYFLDLALDRAAAKEVRLFGLGSWIIDRFRSEQAAGLGEIHRRHRRVVDLAVVAVLASLAIGSALAFILIEGSTGRVDIGSVALVSGAILVGAVTLVSGEGWVWDLAAAPITRLVRAERRLALPTSVDARPSVELRRGLELEGLAFRYPGGDWVLRNVDLTVRAGESVAIVGSNGAGKTTLVKLLCRLYEPTAGRIRVDGVDLLSVDAEEWASRLAVIFQDFVHYPLTARDNVTLGRELPAVAMDEVAAEADATEIIAGLPAGWDTPLSRSHPRGSDLSGGQWQRIALARGLAAVKRGAQLMILDEPTASLDAAAEAAFNRRLLQLASGVTTIIVSHRFPTVRRAQRIVVLDGGAIVESGSHDELLAADGLYARMFRIQAARFSGAE